MEYQKCQQTTPKDVTPMMFGWGLKLASMDPTYGPNTANWGSKNGQATYQPINKPTY